MKVFSNLEDSMILNVQVGDLIAPKKNILHLNFSLSQGCVEVSMGADREGNNQTVAAAERNRHATIL